MKNSAFLSMILGLLLTVGFEAHSIMIPGWERPIYKANLRTFHSSGSFYGFQTAEIVMTKKDGAEYATMFILQIGTHNWELPVKQVFKSECGTKYFTAETANLKVFFVDYSSTVPSSACVAVEAWQTWHVFLKSSSLDKASDDGEIELMGEPETIYTILDHN